jgi:hypothetical protein
MSKRSEANGGPNPQDPTLSLSDSQILSAVDKRTPPPPPARPPAPSRDADHSMWLGRVVISDEFAPQGTKRKKRFLRAPMWMVIGAIVVGSSAGAGLYFVTHQKRSVEPTASAGPASPSEPAPAPTPAPTPAVPPPAPAPAEAATSLTEAPKPAPKPTVRKRTSKSAKAASKKKSKKAAAVSKKKKAAKSSRTRSR